MLEQIMSSSALSAMSRGLQAANLRQEVISNNIANVNTPNFKKSDVVFEDLLAKELNPGQSGKLEMVRTNDRHLPAGADTPAAARVERQDTKTMRADNNNVDIDVEMANLSKNHIYYNSLAREMGSYLTKMKNVITSK